MTERELSSLFSQIELRLIESLKRNVKKHKSWENDLGFKWPAWQAEKIRHLERFRKENESVMNEYRKVIDDEIRKMLLEQYGEGQNSEKELFEDFSAEMSDDSFFGIFDEKIESLIEEVQGKVRTAETAALRMTDDVYRQTILKADLAIQTGGAAKDEAVKIAVEDFARKGINCIEYKDGRRVNIADYAEMALRTSNKRAALIGAAKQRAAMGFDTVRVSSYDMCSPTCLPWQGKAYIDDVYGVWDGEKFGNMGKSKDGDWHLLLSAAIAAGLFHPHCRHTLFTYRKGDRLPPPKDDGLIRKKYKLEQKQRAKEREIRKWKRRELAADDIVMKQAYKKKIREAQASLREFIGENSEYLRRDYAREKVYNFKLENPRKTDIIRGARYVEGDFSEGETVTKELGPISEDKREQFVNDFVKDYAGDKYEHMLIIDRDGYGHYVTSNKPAGITCDMYSDILKDSYNIHTHPPDETQYSFSTDVDIPAMFADGTKVMEACDTKYRYRFERPENLTFEEWEQARAEIQTRIYPILDEKGYTEEEYQYYYQHTLIEETCKKLNINAYKRWEI